MDEAHPGLGLEQVFDIRENPRWARAEVIEQAIRKADQEYQGKRRSRRDRALKEWRDHMSKKAVEGR